MKTEPRKEPLSKAFESACEEAIGGWLWDESFSRLYTEKVSLGVCEMREISNTLRKIEGRAEQITDTFSDERAKRSNK